MKAIKFSLFAVVSLIFIVVCVVNREVVSLSLFPFPYSVDAPLFILALSCMGFGAIITGLVMNIKIISLYNSNRKIKQRIKAVEDENKLLRSEREQALPALIQK